MRFYLADALTGRLGSTVEPVTWTYAAPLTGAGVGSVVFAVPEDEGDLASLQTQLASDALQVLPRTETGEWLTWGGPTTTPAAVDRAAGTVTLGWTDWRGWHYDQLLRKGDYLKLSVEQATAFRDLALKIYDLIEAGDDRTTPAVPAITVDTLPPTGIVRQVTARRWDKVGDWLDNLTRRDQGAEWWTSIEPTSDPKVIRPRTRFAWPQRYSRLQPLRLDLDQHGGNITEYDPPESKRRTGRVVGLGAGSPPDQLWAHDDDPDLAEGGMLLRETTTSHSDVSRRGTLYDHAASERDALGATETMSVTLTGTDPAVGSYEVGDRAAVVIDDGWTQIDVPAARIIAAAYEGQGGDVVKVVLTLDLADADLTAAEIADA